MKTDHNELKRVVHVLMNDVVEQCFEHMVHHPHQCDELNAIIRDASKEINYLCLKVDAHNHHPSSKDAENHYQSINHDAQRKSLELLARLQRVQRSSMLSGGGERPGDFSSPSRSS